MVLVALVIELLVPPPLLECNLALLGAVSHDSAIVWVHGCSEKSFSVQCTAADSSVVATRASGDVFYDISDGRWLGTAQVGSLSPSTLYSCKVIYFDSTLSDALQVKTFPPPGQMEEKLDIVHGSCSSISIWPWNSLDSSFNLIAKINPRILFLLGDNAYTDLTEYLPWYRKGFDAAHRNVLRQKSLQTVLKNIPSYVM